MHRAHGLGATKRAGLAGYAQAFASAGYGCVVFDYRRWGDSGEDLPPNDDIQRIYPGYTLTIV